MMHGRLQNNRERITRKNNTDNCEANKSVNKKRFVS